MINLSSLVLVYKCPLVLGERGYIRSNRIKKIAVLDFDKLCSLVCTECIRIEHRTNPTDFEMYLMPLR